MTPKPKKILIVGANFAGLTAAIQLPKTCDVTVVDPSPDFEWIPGIHEILSGVKTPQGLRLNRSQIVARAGHRFVQDQVTHIDTRRRRATTAGGDILPFDGAIVAVGGISNNYHIPGVDQHTWPFRTVADSLAIEKRMEELQHKPAPLHVVVVGGGLSGVEALGELLRRYRHRPEISFAMVEASAQLMPGFPKALDADLRRMCQEHRVSFHTGESVARVTPQGVWLASGKRLPSALTIWTAGLAPPPLLRDAKLIRPPHTWAAVHQTLQSRYASSIFVIGDAAALPKPASKQAFNAIDMGALAAQNVTRWLADESLKDFKAPATPILLAFGDLQTYLVAGKTVLASKTLAGAKEGVYQLFMAQTAPQPGLQGVPGALRRLRKSWKELVVPGLLSIKDFRATPDCRPLKLL
ncbi:MAG: FAD-dependent oxidoreductase [Rhodoferax sp.]|nr:FAD-dependent oxidoreductase [Rhodoferax sp.]